jgi:transposase
VIQASKPEPRIMRYELTDFEWAAIRSFLPNKPRGIPRVDDRRVLNGIFWVLRSGAPWRDLPETYGPRTTCYNRLVRWRQAGVWDWIMDALADHGRLFRAPSNMNFEEAATLPVALATMHNAVVTNGALQPGQSVLIQGASSCVGLMAMQIAKLTHMASTRSNTPCCGLPSQMEISDFPNFYLTPPPNHLYISPHPVPVEGRWPSSRTLGRVAVDAAVSGAWSWLQGGLMLRERTQRADDRHQCPDEP